MPKPIHDQVVVITGASSGIGRATARLLAAEGARVVVTARRAEALDELVEGIDRNGGEGLAVPGDVTSEADMEAVARAAVERFGRLDSWINNAAVYIQGRVEDVTLEEYRRLLEVNLLGLINGSKQALRYMLRQEEGVIVQVSSIVAERAAPLSSPYAASKRAIDGFVEALRSELLGTGVRVSTVYLPAVDTPIYQHARGKLGTMPKPPPPVLPPERAARALKRAAEKGRTSLYPGLFRHLYLMAERISPALGDRFLARVVGFTVSDRPVGPDNLYGPSPEPARERGGWADDGFRGLTLRETVKVMPLESALAACAVAVGLVLTFRKLLR